MPNKTFFWFFLPTGLAMILFIGLPIISTGIQSFYAQHDQVVKEVKKCDPFGCTVSIVVDNEETTKLREAKPLGKFNGFGTYVDRNHLAIDEIKKFWNETESFGAFVDQVTNLPFYKALIFTLTYCLFVTPNVLLLGFIIALSLNAVARKIRAGQVSINGGARGPAAPFGGFKTSGNGREHGLSGLNECLETKAIIGN